MSDNSLKTSDKVQITLFLDPSCRDVVRHSVWDIIQKNIQNEF